MQLRTQRLRLSTALLLNTTMKKDLPEFQKIQYRFAGHIRNPDAVPAPENIEDRRMGIYRELFYNNVEGFISGAFPVLRKLYSDEDWHSMVRDFFVHHHCHSPYFLEISEEFLQYLQQEHEARPCDPPFLLELSHYEWVELALTVAEEEHDLSNIDPNGDLLEQAPALSSLAWNLDYQWPVHTLGPNNNPTTPPAEATHIVVYRDRNDKIRFVLITPVTAALLQLMEQHPEASGRSLCEQIAQQMQHPDPTIVIEGGRQALEELRSKGIILGSHR